MHDYVFTSSECAAVVSVTLLTPSAPDVQPIALWRQRRSARAESRGTKARSAIGASEREGSSSLAHNSGSGVSLVSEEMFNSAYMVLQQLARRYPEPVAQIVHVFVSGLRDMLHRLVFFVMHHASAAAGGGVYLCQLSRLASIRVL